MSVMFLALASFSETINISGKIIGQDSLPVSGATAKLLIANIQAISNDSGVFLLKNDISKDIPGSQLSLHIEPLLRNGVLTFSVDKEGEAVRVEIFNVRGALISQLSDNASKLGIYSTNPIISSTRTLGNGFAIVRLKIGTRHYTFRQLLLNQLQRSRSSTSLGNQFILKKAAGSTIFDTLLISKSGFFEIKNPIESYSTQLTPIVEYENKMTAYDSTISQIMKGFQPSAGMNIILLSNKKQAYCYYFTSNIDTLFQFPNSSARTVLLGIVYDTSMTQYRGIPDTILDSALILQQAIKIPADSTKLGFQINKGIPYELFIFPDDHLFNVSVLDSSYDSAYAPYIVRLVQNKPMAKASKLRQKLAAPFNLGGINLSAMPSNVVAQFYSIPPASSAIQNLITSELPMPSDNYQLQNGVFSNLTGQIFENNISQVILPETNVWNNISFAFSTNSYLQTEHAEFCSLLSEKDIQEQLTNALLDALKSTSADFVKNVLGYDLSAPKYLYDNVQLQGPLQINDTAQHKIQLLTNDRAEVSDANKTVYENILSKQIPNTPAWALAFTLLKSRASKKLLDLIVDWVFKGSVDIELNSLSLIIPGIINPTGVTVLNSVPYTPSAAEMLSFSIPIVIQAANCGQAQIPYSKINISASLTIKFNNSDNSPCIESINVLNGSIDFGQPLQVTVYIPPQIDFSATPTAGTAPLAVQFSASSKGPCSTNIKGWLWDFGDGQTTTSNTALISHTYSAVGTYDVKVSATDNSGNTTNLSKPGYINVSPNPCCITCNNSVSCDLWISTDRTSWTQALSIGAGKDTCMHKLIFRYYRYRTGTDTTIHDLGKAVSCQ
jgi:PKD repeat protein